MPEFIPEHTPVGLDDFTEGYMIAAEWLLPDDGPKPTRGWTKAAVRQAVAECTDFQRDNEADLARYAETTGRDMASAGSDFSLTRNHHGAGFWDRGDDPCLRRLTDAAHVYGTRDGYVHRGWINWE